MFVNGVYPGKSLKTPLQVVESPGKQCSNVCTNPVSTKNGVWVKINHLHGVSFRCFVVDIENVLI